MKNRLRDALKHATADYADIRLETEERQWLSYRGPEVESSGTSSVLGGIVRACTKGGWGVAVFDALDDLPEQVRIACRCAALAGRDKTHLAEVPPADADHPATLERDFRGVPLDDKLALMQTYNDLLLNGHPAVETSVVAYNDSFRVVHFGSTHDVYYREERPRVTMMLRATARDGAQVQNAFGSAASATSYAAVEGLEAQAGELAERAGALLRAPKPPSGKHTVILNTRMAGTFIHEAFGHLSEADFLYENPCMREQMPLGRSVGPAFLNVYDDGTRVDTPAGFHFDEEGAPASKTRLIRNGALAGHLHSRETAAQMEEPPTGNARAIGRAHSPIVRMTSTYIAPGTTPRESLFADVADGIYACDLFGGQTEFEQFTFSAAYGYRIRNGQVGELLRDITLSGNVFETLHQIDGIADDLEIHYGAGGCGKGGQSPLPVGLGAPHVRIRNVAVG